MSGRFWEMNGCYWWDNGRRTVKWDINDTDEGRQKAAGSWESAASVGGWRVEGTPGIVEALQGMEGGGRSREWRVDRPMGGGMVGVLRRRGG